MRPQAIVWRNRPGHEFGLLRLDARIHMRAKVAVGPSIEAAVAHRSEVVGHEVAAELVALIHDRPEGAAGGLPGQAIGIAQARGEHA